MITSVLAAYALPDGIQGQGLLFYLFLSMMMVPEPIYLISSIYCWIR